MINKEDFFECDSIAAGKQAVIDDFRWLEVHGGRALKNPTIAEAYTAGHEAGWRSALSWAKLHGYIKID